MIKINTQSFLQLEYNDAEQINVVTVCRSPPWLFKIHSTTAYSRCSRSSCPVLLGNLEKTTRNKLRFRVFASMSIPTIPGWAGKEVRTWQVHVLICYYIPVHACSHGM